MNLNPCSDGICIHQPGPCPYDEREDRPEHDFEAGHIVYHRVHGSSGIVSAVTPVSVEVVWSNNLRTRIDPDEISRERPEETNHHRAITEQRDQLLKEVQFLTNRNIALRFCLEEILDEYLTASGFEDWRDGDMIPHMLTSSTCLLSAVAVLKNPGDVVEQEIGRMREKVEAYRRLRQHVRKDGTPKRLLSKEEAERDAARLGRDAYQCEVCEAWHLGSDRSRPVEER